MESKQAVERYLNSPGTTPFGRNWAYEYLRGQQYHPKWQSFPDHALWAIAYWQGGP